MAPLRFVLPPRGDAGAFVREMIEAELRSELSPNAVGNLKLVASELVNNAVVHGDGPVSVAFTLDERAVRVEVTDEGETPAATIAFRPAGPDGGYGLRVVDALASRWGARDGSTHVWAEVPRD